MIIKRGKVSIMLKALLCNVTRKPFCLVDVPADVKSIKFAGEYTKDGQAVNVSNNKLTASKRVMNSCDAVNLLRACYHAESDTFYLSSEIVAVIEGE